MKIVPSLLNAPRNWKEMKAQLAPLVAKKLISSVHLDPADGKLVDNYTLDWLNAELVKKLKRTFPGLKIAVHLMTQNPENYAEQFIRAGADRIWFHVDARRSDKKLAQLKRKYKDVEIGPVVNPETNENKLKQMQFTCVLIMTIHPGKGGQRLLKYMLKKVKKIKRAYPTATISVDGGVDLRNIRDIAAAGADEAVAGTAVFKGNVVNNVKKLIRHN